MVVLFLWITGVTVQLSSTISENHNQQVCPGEQVTYRCNTDGSRLEWSLSQISGGSITYIQTNPRGLALFRDNGNIWALLVAGTPLYESILTIESSVNVSAINVTCATNGSVDVVESYELASEFSILYYYELKRLQ